MESLAPLYALQQLDLEIDHVAQQCRTLRASLADDHAVRQAEEAAAHESKTLRDHQLRLRELEGESEANTAKLKREEARLYSSNVRTAKDMGAVQREIDHAKHRQAEIEDALLVEMEAVDEHQKTLAALQQSLAALQERRSRDVAAWTAQLAEDERRLGVLKGERASAAAPIPPAQLQQYEQLRARKGGRAIALLEGNACGACRVTLPMSLVQRARTSAQVCDNCGRLLYAPPR